LTLTTRSPARSPSEAPTPGFVQAQRCFRSAVEIAQPRQARTPELWARVSLAQLLRVQARREEARTALLDLYGSFTEGWSTPDLTDARLLLDALA
jgi:hypothetical protein